MTVENMNLSGNTIFIPGATSGMGLALALRLQKEGNTVIVGGRRVELLDQIATDHPGIGTVQIDTADPASITAAAEDVLARHPGLNVLVTMAGIMRVEDWSTPAGFLASAEETVTTNLLGPIRLIGAFIRPYPRPDRRHHHDRVVRVGLRPAGRHAHLQCHQGCDPPAERVDPAAAVRDHRARPRTRSAGRPH